MAHHGTTNNVLPSGNLPTRIFGRLVGGFQFASHVPLAGGSNTGRHIYLAIKVDHGEFSGTYEAAFNIRSDEGTEVQFAEKQTNLSPSDIPAPGFTSGIKFSYGTGPQGGDIEFAGLSDGDFNAIENDQLFDKINSLTQGSDVVAVYGLTYSPNGNGLHDVHMNSGTNPDDPHASGDRDHEDGAIAFYFNLSGENAFVHWVFVKFTSQRVLNDGGTPNAGLIDQVIRQNLFRLNKPGVLSVRPGFESVRGWVTNRPAIVVNVDKKVAPGALSAKDLLPETLAGFPVDVREPAPLEKMRISGPGKFASIVNAIPPELRPPSFAFERNPHGELLTQTGSPTVARSVAVRRPPKTQIEYTAPEGEPLDPISDTFKITCHASPDAGWPTLGPFLKATQGQLTIGMYDFTSAHILDAFKTIATSNPQPELNLVLDHPPLNKTHDQTDEETHDDLETSFGRNLAFAWALEDKDPMVSSWIYPSAYHIKVAVRDSSAFWLSSGNFNNSNQPDINPIVNPTLPDSVFKSCDRDWHVIVEHPKMAKLFEAYLLNDLAVAQANSSSSASANAGVSLNAVAARQAALDAPVMQVTAGRPKKFFAPKTITSPMTIQPVLTPDNYAPLILKLINSATSTFYMQTQYITPASERTADENGTFTALIDAIAAKISAGIDVRIIMSQFETAAKLELIQAAGIDLSRVRIQANVHNKGMIVDSKVVVVGSQNWSGDGTLRNRDATLIIENTEAAKYWEEIFLHDWDNMAKQQTSD